MRLTLVGLGKSNRAFLERVCKVEDVFVSENRELSPQEKELLKECGASYEIGHTSRILESDDIIVSPGVSPFSEVGKMILEGRRYTTEVSAFFEYLSPEYERVIGVTGTNGKSTTTAMIHHVLGRLGYSSCLCGNNERPVSTLKEHVDFIVLELSSFQLFWARVIPIDYGVILNLSPDHLDWHKSFEHYKRSKYRMRDFSRVLLKGPDLDIEGIPIKRVDEREVPDHLRNPQNLENISAVVELFEVMGFRKKDVLGCLEDFKPLPHRMEFVAKIDGIAFYDDSKATNTHAVVNALKNFERVTLILSGMVKEDDLEDFKRAIREKAEAVILLGDAIKRVGDLGVPTFEAADMYEAVEKAFEVSNGVVLLSPGGASFDLYSGYAQRGEDFKKAVRRLAELGVQGSSSSGSDNTDNR